MIHEKMLKKFDESPPKDFVATNDGGISSYIPIFYLEGMLDMFAWSTKNFTFQIYKDGYANLCVAASLELEITHPDHEDKMVKRTFVGACNFPHSAIVPNQHFLATAKSECIKNAASEIGKYFGRGLNKINPPSNETTEKKVVKSKPDSKIMQQFMKAIESGDEHTITMLNNIYEIKIS